MPKDTFLNLPESKRQLIVDAAMDEFATWGFDNASINRIVAETQIAKGSFYQYFEDKTDLFRYLTTRISQDKLEFLSPTLQNPAAHDFFTLLKEMYQSGLAFAKEHPKAALVGNLVYRNKEHPVYHEILSDGKNTALAFYEELIKAAMADGEVRPDIDARFIAHILLSLSLSIFEYYFEEVKEADFDMNEIDDDIMHIVQMTLDFVQKGITLSTKELAL